jgi:hypothetical protein
MSNSIRCPKCQGTSGAAPVESRHEAGVQRRRRQCRDCGQRFTTYELLQADYKRLTQAAAQLQQIEAVLGRRRSEYTPAPAGVLNPCASCGFNTGTRCSFDYPEYGSAEARDCTMRSLPLARQGVASELGPQTKRP